MIVGGMNHVTLRCAPEQLTEVESFYVQVIGLTPGPRPSFDFAGAWLYADREPIVHLAAVLPARRLGAPPDPDNPPSTDPDSASASVVPGGVATTGAIDHIALRVGSTLDACRRQLEAHAIRFTEAPVPGFPLHQVFVRDPLGVKLELNFEVAP